MKVQASSATLMTFLIQDILDFAQINSGNFRKNINSFDIRDAIEDVINFQKSIAEYKGINLFATFKNISESDSDIIRNDFIQI